MMDKPVVLYVEDDPSSRKIMRMLLSGRMGLSNVVFFEDSENFVKRVQALDPRPDLIFLDIHVKPHNGFELLKILRELEAFNGVPIIALTASVMNEEVQMLRTAGFNGCLAKPVDMETFPDSIHRIMNGEVVWRIIS